MSTRWDKVQNYTAVAFNPFDFFTALRYGWRILSASINVRSSSSRRRSYRSLCGAALFAQAEESGGKKPGIFSAGLGGSFLTNFSGYLFVCVGLIPRSLL
jgi:hypothetical protein